MPSRYEPRRRADQVRRQPAQAEELMLGGGAGLIAALPDATARRCARPTTRPCRGAAARWHSVPSWCWPCIVRRGWCWRRSRPRSLWDKLFDNSSAISPSYIDAAVPVSRPASGSGPTPVEWFWGLKRWLRLLGETLLMAYVGTLLGAVGGFCSASSPPPTSRRGGWLRMAGAPLLRALPHRAGARLRADVRDRLRARPDGRRAGHRASTRWARSASCSPRSSRTST